MQSIRAVVFRVLLLIGLGWMVASCQTLREVANLRKVNFQIDRVAEATLAGVPVEDLRDRDQLSAQEILHLSSAAAAGELPLSFVLHLRAENPPDNSVQARLVKMDWTLFLDEKETVSGVFDHEMVLPPGEARDVPVPIRLDLVRFFGNNLQDLVDLALAATGRGGEPKVIELQARPTIRTALGPIRYPNPIVIVREEVGAQPSE